MKIGIAAAEVGVPTIVVLTKMDKLTPAERKVRASERAAQLGLDTDQVIPFSAVSGEGRDALALGMSPGPAVGALLRRVRAWWMAGGCVADADACRAELARLAAG